MSNFWHIYIGLIVLINILLYSLLLYYTKNIEIENILEAANVNTVEYDEYHYSEIEELNEPLPKWWYWMFFISIFYGIGYLIFYPGFGKFSGVLNWTSSVECYSEIEKHKSLYNDLYKSYRNIGINDLYKNENAFKIGRNIFLNKVIKKI